MAEKTRILQIIYSFEIEGEGGGASRFAIELAQHLDPQYFDRKIYALWHTNENKSAKHIQELEKEGIKTFTGTFRQSKSPYKDFLNAIKAISKQLDKWKPDIIHSHSEFGDIAGLIYKFKYQEIKIVRTVHNGSSLEWPRRPLRRWILSYVLYPIFFSKEIGVSQGITNNLNQRYLIRWNKQKAICIPNAIDLQRFNHNTNNKNQIRETLGLPRDCMIIGTVGRLSPEKGFDIFIRAIPNILSHYPQAYFIIVGSGELEAKLQDLAESLGVRNRIKFTGQISNIEDILASIDLFVSSSRWEGLPTTLLESMATGIPVVATDVTGNRELIHDQITGWLAPPENPDELAKRINQALISIENGLDYTDNAQKKVQAYSIISSAKAYQDMYIGLMNSPLK